MLHTVHPDAIKRATTDELRKHFLITDLWEAGSVRLRVAEIDRVVVGGVTPGSDALDLPCPKDLASSYFCERRELGVINVGAAGTVTVDGTKHELGNRDALYIGRGSKKVVFASADAGKPAQFFLVSYPAHAAYPTKRVGLADIKPRVLGSPEAANHRKLHQMIVPGVVESCQLVMGFTQLEKGSIWNTMPPHTHARRSEVYMYFDVAPEAIVFHFMGEPSETRHLVVHDRQAILSPSWSIHSGAGTGPYTFVWAMGGENQAFDDMDWVALDDLR